MMAQHGAVPTNKTSIPSAVPIAWRVFLKASPLVSVRVVNEQAWDKACHAGAILLGAVSEPVDAEPATEAQ